MGIKGLAKLLSDEAPDVSSERSVDPSFFFFCLLRLNRGALSSHQRYSLSLSLFHLIK